MNDTEVLELSPNNLPAALLKTTVKERQNIADIIRDYGHRLQGFIRKRVKSTEDAEDILQEVYFQLAEADRLLKPIDQIAAWLFTVARNRITDLYRKRRRQALAHPPRGTGGATAPEPAVGILGAARRLAIISALICTNPLACHGHETARTAGLPRHQRPADLRPRTPGAGVAQRAPGLPGA